MVLLKHTSNKPEQIVVLQDISRQTEDDFQPFIQNIMFIQQNIQPSNICFTLNCQNDYNSCTKTSFNALKLTAGAH